jgi:hypothetical protein
MFLTHQLVLEFVETEYQFVYSFSLSRVGIRKEPQPDGRQRFSNYLRLNQVSLRPGNGVHGDSPGWSDVAIWFQTIENSCRP